MSDTGQPQNDPHEIKQTTIRIPMDLYRILKQAAIKNERTVTFLLIEAVKEKYKIE